MNGQRNIELTSSYEVCSAHKLFNPEWDENTNRKVFGKCADLHGHQYRLEITLSGPISEKTGMLVNGFDVDRIVGEVIVKKMDHQYLNDRIPFFKKNPPTAEWIAVWVFDSLKTAFPPECRVKRVRVFETPSMYADFCG